MKMKSMHRYTTLPATKSVFALFLNLVLSCFAYGQDSSTQVPDTTCVQIDMADVLRKALNKEPKNKKEGSGSLLLLPIIGANPATGFMFGVGGQYAFKMPGSTLYSSLSGSIQYTTKNQFIFMLKNSVYTKDNRLFFTGDWRYLIYSQTTYGLGTHSPEGGILDYQYSLGGQETSSDSLAQPMKFNFLRLHQSASYKIRNGFYAGIGYNLDSFFKIVDEKLRLNEGDSLITSHYAYSQYYGFSTKNYFSSALNVNFVYDTRDNMINPYKGIYAMVSWRGNFKVLGNKNYGNYFQLEWRSFHPLSKRNPRHLMSFWLMGNFTPPGEFPYLILPATAYDQRGRSARGYTQGRFRGNNLVYGEAEYRFPISSCGGVLGGVLFINGTTANNKAQNLKLFESVKPGYGMGLRIMVDKQSRTNLAVDIGFGDKSSGFYLAATETF